MKKSKFGFCSWYTPVPGPFSLYLAGTAGYDGVQISDLGGDEQAYPLKNKAIQKGFVDAAKENCIEIQMVNLLALGPSGLMKHPPDSEKGRLAVTSLQNGVDVCAEMCVSNLFIPCVFAGSIENEYELDLAASYLKLGHDMAEKRGITLLFESFMGYDRTMRLYERAGGGFKLCYDSLNPLKYGFGNPVEEVKQYGCEMIHTVHIKDCTENYREAEGIGKGVGQFFEIAEVLHQIGYTGWIVNENNYFIGPKAKKRDPMQMIKEDLGTLKSTFR